MDVFVIPIARDRYELYSETQTDAGAARPGESSGGWVASLRQRFAVMLRAAEERSDDGDAAPVDEGWLARGQAWLMGWVAQRIVEQRLLWTLRWQSEAVAVYPQRLTFDEAMALIRRELRRDHDRHRIWLVVYALGLVASAPLALVPGPNVLAYYFAFSVWGHWLSFLGARRGLNSVSWTGRACPPLDELQDVASMPPAARHARVRDVGARVRLQHLTRFVERVVLRHA